jgi:hypothetical protein
MEKDNERLKILIDALLKLADYWTKGCTGQSAHAIYEQINFIRREIRKELKK